MQLAGSAAQSTSQRNISQLIHPMGGVRASLVGAAAALAVRTSVTTTIKHGEADIFSDVPPSFLWI